MAALEDMEALEDFSMLDENSFEDFEEQTVEEFELECKNRSAQKFEVVQSLIDDIHFHIKNQVKLVGRKKQSLKEKLEHLAKRNLKCEEKKKSINEIKIKIELVSNKLSDLKMEAESLKVQEETLMREKLLSEEKAQSEFEELQKLLLRRTLDQLTWFKK